MAQTPAGMARDTRGLRDANGRLVIRRFLLRDPQRVLDRSKFMLTHCQMATTMQQ
jgi:hypothetical protein